MAEKRGPDPDELLAKLQRREEKRSNRPIKLYETAYEQEEDRIFKEELFSASPAAKREHVNNLKRFFEESDIDEEIREKARADLTPEERDALEIEETMADLKGMRSMSRRITDLQFLDDHDKTILFKLHSADPKFIAPIMIGMMKRPARQEKAQRAIQRIRQGRGEDQPHK